MKLNCVTFTGVDDSTDIETLVDLSKTYPNIEWGIVLSSRYLQILRTGLEPVPTTCNSSVLRTVVMRACHTPPE